MLPDVFVEREPGPRFLDRIEHPRTTLIQPPSVNFFDSQEKPEGFVAGPDISSAGSLGELSILDFAPTCLNLMGQPENTGVFGNPMKGRRFEVMNPNRPDCPAESDWEQLNLPSCLERIFNRHGWFKVHWRHMAELVHCALRNRRHRPLAAAAIARNMTAKKSIIVRCP